MNNSATRKIKSRKKLNFLRLLGHHKKHENKMEIKASDDLLEEESSALNESSSLTSGPNREPFIEVKKDKSKEGSDKIGLNKGQTDGTNCASSQSPKINSCSSCSSPSTATAKLTPTSTKSSKILSSRFSNKKDIPNRRFWGPEINTDSVYYIYLKKIFYSSHSEFGSNEDLKWPYKVDTNTKSDSFKR